MFRGFCLQVMDVGQPSQAAAAASSPGGRAKRMAARLGSPSGGAVAFRRLRGLPLFSSQIDDHVSANSILFSFRLPQMR